MRFISRVPRYALLASLCSVLSTPVGWAADAPQTNSTARTSEVVVTATRTERELFDVPSSMAVVTSQQMARTPKRTIAEQLQDIPGIQVTDGGMGGGAKRIMIRGESAARVLILIDGMKLSEQKSMDGSMLLIGPENIERIEVIKGSASVLYGSEAIGGVVNIITKKGGSKPIQGTLVSTYDGSNDSFTPFGALYGTSNGFSYRVSGDYTDASDKRGGSGTIDNSSYLQRNYSAYLDYAWNNGKAGFGYDHFWSNINIPSSSSVEASTSVTVNLGLPQWKRDRLYGFFEQEKISDYLQKIKLTAFTQKTEKDFANEIDVLVRMNPMMTMNSNTELFTKNEQRSYGSTLQTDWTLGDSHYVVAGIDYLRDNLDADESRSAFTTMYMNGNPMPGYPRPSADNGLYKHKAHQETLALFLQDEWSLHEDWTATLGARSTWVWSALDETNDAKLSTGKDSDSHIVGSAGLVYSGFEDWRLRANYSQGYRYPILQQMYMGTVHGSADVTYPNPNLKPETSQSFELGARYEIGGFKADLATYYTMAEDYIYRAASMDSGTTRYTFSNSNSADTYGSELELSYTYAPWNLTPYINGAYMHRTIDRGSDNGGSTSQTGDPRWTGKTGVRYEKEFSPEFSMHTDAFVRMAASAREQLTTGETLHNGGWATANFAIGGKFGKDKALFADLNLNNIFDKRYTPAAASLEDPGFHAVLRIGMEF